MNDKFPVISASRLAWSRQCEMPLFRAAALTLAMLGMTSNALAGRDPLLRVEPPSPLGDKTWEQVREEQMSFVTRLSLWGVTVEAKAGDESPIENTPDILKVEMKWKSPNEIGLTVGIKVPRVVQAYEFEGEYKFEVSPEAATHGSKFGIAFDGAKVSGEIKSAPHQGIGYEVAGEFKRSLLELKTALGSAGSSYQIALGLGRVKIKLDPLKYARRFATFAPRFVDLARGPAGDSLNAVQVRINPGLVAAALTNNVNIWLEQMRIAKAARFPNDELLSSLPLESGQSRISRQAEYDADEDSLRRLEATVSRAEETRRLEKVEAAFFRELRRHTGNFRYLAAAAGLACESPDGLLDEVRKGRYTSVSLEREYLTAYLGMLSPGDGISRCRYELLSKINNSDASVHWTQLQMWGSEYRTAHPSSLDRLVEALRAFRDAFRRFGSSEDAADSPGEGTESSSQNRSDHSRSAPDVMRERPARQLRGIDAHGWN